jgi:hypothetical protein
LLVLHAVADRRRAARVIFHAPPDARAQAIADAVLESDDDGQIVVLSAQALRRDEVLVLRTTPRAGAVTTRACRVLSCTPLPEVPPRFRVRLVPDTSPAAWPLDEGPES